MHFVDRHRPLAPSVERWPVAHPFAVAPAVLLLIDDGRGVGWDLEIPAVRIGLMQQMSAARPNFALVAAAVAQLGDEDLPHAGSHQLAHRVDAAVPAIEVTDDADSLGVRRPHREVNAGETLDRGSPA